jgi:hypothetical protein
MLRNHARTHSQTQPDSVSSASSAAPLFATGRLIVTRQADLALSRNDLVPSHLVRRHERGDWGDVDAIDATQNELCLYLGTAILSCYNLKTGQRLWVQTSEDRSLTILSLAGEKPEPEETQAEEVAP